MTLLEIEKEVLAEKEELISLTTISLVQLKLELNNHGLVGARKRLLSKQECTC